MESSSPWFSKMVRFLSFSVMGALDTFTKSDQVLFAFWAFRIHCLCTHCAHASHSFEGLCPGTGGFPRSCFSRRSTFLGVWHGSHFSKAELTVRFALTVRRRICWHLPYSSITITRGSRQETAKASSRRPDATYAMTPQWRLLMCYKSLVHQRKVVFEICCSVGRPPMAILHIYIIYLHYIIIYLYN